MTNWNTVKGKMDQLIEADPTAVPSDSDTQSVQSLFDNFRQTLTGIVETSLSTLVEDEWVRTTISTALTVKLQGESDQMATATLDELRNQFRRSNENAVAKLNDARKSSNIRMETQKVELKAQMDQVLAQHEKEMQAKYAAELKASQEETEKLKQSLESSLTQQLAAKAALQKAKKEADALRTQVSEYERSIQKLEGNAGAVEELEAMKRALQAEVAAVRSLPESLPGALLRPSAYHGRCSAQVKREMRKQIDSVNAELNQQIETVQTELKQVKHDIKTETGKVQPDKKPAENLDCKGLLQELMTLMWGEINSARQAARDQREMLSALKESMAELKAENEQARQAAMDNKQLLKEAKKEAEDARNSTITVTRRAEAAERRVADLTAELELERGRAAAAGALGDQVAELERQRDSLAARQAELEAELAAAIAERDGAIAKLESYKDAQLELEEMKAALEAEMEAVRSLPPPPYHDHPHTTGVALPSAPAGVALPPAPAVRGLSPPATAVRSPRAWLCTGEAGDARADRVRAIRAQHADRHGEVGAEGGLRRHQDEP